MPVKNILKQYLEKGYYHLYNRGVNKGLIFIDEQDYKVFLTYLKIYLLPQDKKMLLGILANPQASQQDKYQAKKQLCLNNFYDEISLLAYCLMPNHYHLLIQQNEPESMEHLMRSLMTRYTMYFNKRYQRSGPLFDSSYKAVLVDSNVQLLHLTRYIHRNQPIRSILFKEDTPYQKQPSSYLNYLGKIKQKWVKTDFILQNFDRSGFNTYQEFVESEDSDLEHKTVFVLKDIILD